MAGDHHRVGEPGSDLQCRVVSSAVAVGPGFLGMSYAPFVVDSNGDVRNLICRWTVAALAADEDADGLEKGFAGQDRAMRDRYMKV